MTGLKRQYRESIIALLHALETARRFFASDPEEVSDTVRRIAESLRHAGITYGIPEIAEEAAWLEQADTLEIPKLIDSLRDKLSELTQGSETEKLGVLIIDDDSTSTRLLEHLLASPNREIFVCRTTMQAYNILEEHSIALVLLDLNLPDGDGRNFLLHVRAFPGTTLMPVLVTTATAQAQAETECLALGADLFIRKPFDPEMVAVAVASRLQRATDFSMQARQDMLTGLPNRAAFYELFGRASSFAARRKEPISIGILDLDHFKLVNDTYGHAVGDDVLRRTAQVLTTSLRQSDQVARWGGEEFVTLFPHTTIHGATTALNKALAALREVKFSASGGRTFQVTFSAGVCEVGVGDLVQESVAVADRLLYIAKSSGRNQVMSTEQPAQTLDVEKA